MLMQLLLVLLRGCRGVVGVINVDILYKVVPFEAIWLIVCIIWLHTDMIVFIRLC